MTETGLELTGRLLIVAFFLVAGLINLQPARVRDHIERMRTLGVPAPAAALWFGLFLQFTGCALVLARWHADIGVIFLMVFTVVATAIFHRFWLMPDPVKRNTARIMLLNNTAVLGGLMLLLEKLQRAT